MRAYHAAVGEHAWQGSRGPGRAPADACRSLIFAGMMPTDRYVVGLRQVDGIPHELLPGLGRGDSSGDDTLVLETDFSTADGDLRLVDCMPVRDRHPDLLRRVECRSGWVRIRSELIPRLDYGRVTPWIREVGHHSSAIAGPDRLTLDADIAHHRDGDDIVVGGRFTWCTAVRRWR
jgi:hypothetical protein